MLPIFPLNTVLFPAGVLPLRVFEPRYMDMVRDCLKHDQAFGVCLIKSGNETGEPAQHEPVGCTALIRSWDMEQLGLLQIWAQGGQRFRVIAHEVQADGLIQAEVAMIEPDTDEPLPAEFADCAELLRRILVDIVEREPEPAHRVVAPPYAFDSLVWVSNRLAEFLPLPPRGKQSLMSADSALARLLVIRDFLQKHKVL